MKELLLAIEKYLLVLEKALLKIHKETFFLKVQEVKDLEKARAELDAAFHKASQEAQP